ncbi:hypothetical protein EVAR_6344_1 [Eumeta japonica]|uniref:Uncharacterized protein n=1 Tax=Eumeta variegata TaxID=151549 RepID=A0A4C1T8R0_EUMVA|nr:hypothetical protein EVAR_6344_1 [Eumeta japonica]
MDEHITMRFSLGDRRAYYAKFRLCAAAVSLLLGRIEPSDGVEKRLLVPRSRSHARLRRNATMSHVFVRAAGVHRFIRHVQPGAAGARLPARRQAVLSVLVLLLLLLLVSPCVRVSTMQVSIIYSKRTHCNCRIASVEISSSASRRTRRTKGLAVDTRNTVKSNIIFTGPSPPRLRRVVFAVSVSASHAVPLCHGDGHVGLPC